jgi:hypothetical protein
MLGDITGPGEQQPSVESTQPERPIDKLIPQSELHNNVLQYILRRLNYSERTMTQFYSRWNSNERKIQAYINLPDYEQQMKQMNKTGAPPAVVSITVPYAFATIWTIVTYLTHTFCGQKPMFQVSSYKAEGIQPAQYMETMLQYNADHTKLILRFIQWFLDAETYGMGAIRCLWDEEFGTRTRWQEGSPGGLLMPNAAPMKIKTRQKQKIFEGNKCQNIDPFMFFPDPRVAMSEVSRRGEFVFWRSFEGKHMLLREQAEGNIKWVDNIPNMPQGVWGEITGKSVRALVSEGQSSPGDPQLRDIRATPYYQIDQGTIEIVPSELGLGDEKTPQKWLFAVGNKGQIIQAEPFDADHGRHPVAVIEPSAFGYAFGAPGTMDFLGPIQDTLSWFINSHIHNVRTALNNMFIVDPSMVEIQDIKNPSPGKLIRLKRAAYGQDVRTVLQQLEVQDVTTNHIQSMQVFLRMGDILAAINDNLRGIQEEGGRKTATEVRTSGEAGASRLAARARYISAQGMTDLAQMMALNMQQNMTMEFYLKVVGQKGAQNPIMIGPADIAGDFWFPVSDGTLPMDRAQLMETWKEIWMAINQNPMLSQQYDQGKIFDYLAELGGAKNIDSFKLAPASPEAIQNGLQSGNIAPLGPGGAGPRPTAGITNGAFNGGRPPVPPAGIPGGLPIGGPRPNA